MRAERLELRNFCQHAERDVDFQPGLTAIIGMNGSGKSNLLGAMVYALTGENPNVGNKNDNIRQGSDPAETSLVRFVFSHNSVRATVTRTLRPENTQTVLTVEGGDTVRGDKRVNSRILEILGVDAQIIKDIVIVRQREIFGFLEKTPAKRAEAFAKLFQTDRAADVYAAGGRHLSGVEIPTIGVSLQEKQQQLEQAQAAESVLQETIGQDTAGELNRRLQSVNEQLRQHATMVTDRQRVGEMEQDARNREATIAHLDRQLAETADALRTLEDAIEGAEVARDAAKAAIATQQHLQAIQRQRSAITDRIEGLQNELAAIEDPPQPADYEPESRRMDLATIGARIRRLQEITSRFDQDQVTECPTCGTPTTEIPVDQYNHEYEEKSREFEELRVRDAASEEWRRACERHATQRRFIRGELRSAEEQLQALGEAPETPPGSPDEWRAAIDEHAQFVSAAKDYRNILQEGERQRATLQGYLDQAETTINRLRDEIHRCPVTDDDAATLRQESGSLTRRFHEVAAAERELSAMTATISQLEASISELRATQQRAVIIRAHVDRVRNVRDVLHRDAAPRMVAQRNLQRIQVSMNEHLGMFDTPYRVEADEGLSFVADFLDGRRQPAERLSVGQQVVLALSFRLAVNFMYADLGFLALDEPTAYLDEHALAGFEPSLQRLREFTASRGLQCLMITHERSLAHLFDDVHQL